MSLRSIAKWTGTKTPTETIDHVVTEAMERLGLESDIEEPENSSPNTDNILKFDNAPGLTFTRLVSATIDNQALSKPNWSKLLHGMIKTLKTRGLSHESLRTALNIPTDINQREDQGYKFYSDIGISFQGQSAADAWKEVERIAKKHKIPVHVRFRWLDQPKAQHPGRQGELTVAI